MAVVIALNLERLRGAKGMSHHVASCRTMSQHVTGPGRGGGWPVAQRLPRYREWEGPARVRNLEAIAGALQVPVRELLEPAVERNNVRFRSHKKLRARSPVLTDVGRWLADDNGLDELLDRRRPFRLQRVAAHAGAGEDRAVATARAARAALGLTECEPVRDICGLLDSAGVKVLPLAVASDGFFGLSVGPSGGGLAVVANNRTLHECVENGFYIARNTA